MTQHEVTPIDPQTEIQTVLHREPTSIAEALDLDVRLGALSGWVNDRKRAVSGWVQAKAEARLAEDGAAPTWRLDDGSVLLTDPDPKPRISNADEFGRWYVADLLDRDPDEVAEDGYVLRFDDRVARRVVATCPSQALLAFLDEHAAGGSLVDAADLLAGRIEVEEEWLVAEDTLDSMVKGKAHALDAGKPRLIVDKQSLIVVDVETGGLVPGTSVSPATKRTVQMRPSTEAKDRVRSELDGLLGAAALGE